MTTVVSPNTFKEWIKSQYANLPQDRNEAIFSMIGTFTQSYEMLANWMFAGMQNEIDYSKYNHKSCERACSIVWYDFCLFYKMSKGAIKVIYATQMLLIKKKLDKFAHEHNIVDFEQWIDNIDVLSQSIDTSPVNSDRPFFSIIVPCYNDGRYKEGVYLDRLLDSICYQGLQRDEFEVIIVDDCSPVPFDDVIEKYSETLNIRTAKTEYNFAPGNTRQKGVDIAKGQWICFADHDDMYYNGSLLAVKDFIEERRERYYVFTIFNGVDTQGRVVKEYKATAGWCHGKFYNLDNFWKPQDIHFIKDLASHEDIAICTQVACALDRMGEKFEDRYLPITTYAWTDNPDSVSHSKFETLDDNGKPRVFLEVYYEDYIRSTGYIYIDQYKAKKLTKEYCMNRMCEVLCYLYIYFQGFQTYREDYSRESLISAGRFLNESKKAYSIPSTVQVYRKIAENDGLMYMKIETMARLSIYYLPHQGVKQWLNMIDRAYKQSLKN